MTQERFEKIVAILQAQRIPDEEIWAFIHHGHDLHIANRLEEIEERESGGGDRD